MTVKSGHWSAIMEIVRFPSVYVEYTAINLENKALLTRAALEKVKLKAVYVGI